MPAYKITYAYRNKGKTVVACNYELAESPEEAACLTAKWYGELPEYRRIRLERWNGVRWELVDYCKVP